MAAQADTTLFPRRFVACMAFLMRVGTTIDDEAQGQKFADWWKAIAGTPGRTASPCQPARPHVPGDPLFEFMRDIRNLELKQGKRTHTAQQRAALTGQVGSVASLTATPRRASGAIGPGQVVQNVQRGQPTRAGSQAFNIRTVWLFAHGTYDGQEVVPLIDRYLAQLDSVLQRSEALTD